MERPRLAAYGNTVYLKGVAACLARDNSLNVVLIDPEAPDCRCRLDELEPDVVAFEHCAADLATPMHLLHERPGRLLVLIDPESEEILVLSSRRAQPTTVAELAEVLLSAIAEQA